MHPSIKIIDDTHFEFDGAVYRNKYLASKKDKLRNLLSTSSVVSGKQNPNEISWGFLLSDGSFHISKDKHKFPIDKILFVIRAPRYTLLEWWETGQILQRHAECGSS